MNIVSFGGGTNSTAMIIGMYVPKKRLVMALDYPDRIVQWSLYLYLNPIYDRLFIEDSYACRKDKGSHKAAKRLQYWMCQVQRKPGTGWYCLKLDISKYFYRVNHEKLLAILERRVKDPAMMAFIRGVVNSRAEQSRLACRAGGHRRTRRRKNGYKESKI